VRHANEGGVPYRQASHVHVRISASTITTIAEAVRMNKLLAQHFRDPAEVIYKDELREVGPKAEPGEGGLKIEPRSAVNGAEASDNSEDSSPE